MNYYAYEMAHAFMSPVDRRPGASPVAWLAAQPDGLTTARQEHVAACEVFENVTRRYGKPEFGIKSVAIGGLDVPVREEIVVVHTLLQSPPFRSRRDRRRASATIPRCCIVAPMSGHYATLLRGTVKAMLPEHDVYITDWVDARDVPLATGRFDLDDFIDYVIDFIRFIGPNTHVMARVPAGGAGARRGRAYGNTRRPVPARLADADGRPDRHAPQPDGRQQARRRELASTGSSTTSSNACPSRMRASCAPSIRASCS